MRHRKMNFLYNDSNKLFNKKTNRSRDSGRGKVAGHFILSKKDNPIDLNVIKKNSI